MAAIGGTSPKFLLGHFQLHFIRALYLIVVEFFGVRV